MGHVVSSHHHLRTMDGRDPREPSRAATPLELLFDLSFVIAFGFAASQYAHALAEAHYGVAFLGFGFSSFAICWAWLNFSWFSSAYDTDDWIFRLATMVQMIGVLVLALGLKRMFASLESIDGRIDNSLMVVGYIIMRVALVSQWLRAAKSDVQRRRTCLAYALGISIVQIGWALQVAVQPAPALLALAIAVLIALELAIPVAAEGFGAIPWNPDHIVERHRLFTTVALGEGVVGTVATLSATVQAGVGALEMALVCVSGIGLTFGLWWVYLIPPSERALRVQASRAYVWACSQMLIVTAIVAVGAGLHVAAYYLAGTSELSATATVLCIAVPVTAAIALVYALYHYLIRRPDPLHRWLLGITGLVIVSAVLAALGGLQMPYCLLLLTLAPAVTVVGYEWKGHRHQEDALEH